MKSTGLGRAHIGIDLGGTKIAGVLLGEQLKTLCYLRRDTPRMDYQQTVQSIVELVTQLDAAWARLGGEGAALPVGIATPGVCRVETGRMSNCNSTWLNDQPLLNDLERYLARSVVLANDADCFALSQVRLQPRMSQGLTLGVI